MSFQVFCMNADGGVTVTYVQYKAHPVISMA
jgi:hypothetical protein